MINNLKKSISIILILIMTVTFIKVDSVVVIAEDDNLYYGDYETTTGSAIDTEITTGSAIDTDITSGSTISIYIDGQDIFADQSMINVESFRILYEEIIDGETQWVDRGEGINGFGNALINLVAYNDSHTYLLSEEVIIDSEEQIFNFITSDYAEVEVNQDTYNQYDNLLISMVMDYDEEKEIILKTSKLYVNKGIYKGYHIGYMKNYDDGTETLYGLGSSSLWKEEEFIDITGEQLFTINASDDFTIGIHEQYININDIKPWFDTFSIKDKYGNILAHIEENNSVTGDHIPVQAQVQVYEEGTSYTTEPIYEAYIDLEYDPILHFNYLTEGFYDIKFIINTYEPMEYMINGVEFINTATSGEPVANDSKELLHFIVDKDETGKLFIEFQTRSDADYSAVDSIDFNLEGDLPIGLVNGDSSGYIHNVFNQYNTRLVKVNGTDELPIEIDEIEGRVRDRNSENNTNTSDPNPNILSINIRNYDGNKINIESGMTYRIYFDTEVSNVIFDSIVSSVYYDGTEKPNMGIMLLNDAEAEWHLKEVGYKWIIYSNDDTSIQTDLKEFKVDSNIHFIGPKVEMNIGDTLTYGEIGQIQILFEGFESEVPDYPTVEAYVGEENIGIIDSQITNHEGIKTNQYILTFNNDVRNENTTIILQNDDVEMLKEKIRNIIYTDRRQAGVYLLAYGHDGHLIGYKKYEDIYEEQYVMPTFELNNELPIIGRYEEDQYGWYHKEFNFWLKYTGMMNNERVIVDGTTSFGNEQIPFILTAGARGDGNFEGQFFFEGYKSPHLNEFNQELLDKNSEARQQYMTASWNEEIEYYHQIPIHPAMKNTITLSFTNHLGQVTELQYDFYPNSQYDIFHWGEIVGEHISPSDNNVVVDLEQYYGNNEAIGLQLITIDHNGVEDIVATYSIVENQEDYVNTWLNHENKEEAENRTRLTFAKSDSDIALVDEIQEHMGVYAKIIYEEQLSDNPEVVIAFERLLGRELRIDKTPPNPFVDFKGVDNIEGNNYYVFLVHFGGDRVSLQAINESNFKIVNQDNQDLNISPALIEGYLDEWEKETLNGNSKEDDQYYGVLLYYPQPEKDWLIEIRGLQDEAGNTMTEPVRHELKIESYFKGYLRDSNYINLGRRELKIIAIDDIPNMTNQLGEEIHWPEVRHMMTDEEGRFYYHNYPGRYRIISIKDTSLGENAPEETVNIDFEVGLSTLGNEEYEQDIIIPAPNVYGNLKRLTEYDLVEQIIFLPEDLYNQYTEIEQILLNDQSYNQLSDEERNQYWTQKSIIFELLSNVVTTNVDGTFESYFSQGSYVLLGKKVGHMDYEKVDEEYVLHITDESSIYDMVDLALNEPNMFIRVEDEQGNYISNAGIEVKMLEEGEHEGYHRYYTSNELGIVPLSLPQQGRYIVTHVSGGYDDQQDGFVYVLHGDYGFNSFEFASEQVEDFHLVLPPMNVTFSVEVDETSIGQDQHISIDIEKKQYFDEEGSTVADYERIANVYSRTGVFSAWLADGDYNIGSIEVEGNWIEDTEENDLALFTVSTSDTEPKEVKIDLSKYYNFEIEVVMDDGTPVQSSRVDFQAGNDYRGITTNSMGKGYYYVDASLEDIVVYINGYEYNNQWIHFNDDERPNVKVTKYNIGPDARATYTITVASPNFRGNIVDNQGNIIFKNGWLNIVNVDTWQGKGYQIDEDGNFAIAVELPEGISEGHFMVQGAGSNHDDYMEIQFTFDVIRDETTGEYIVMKNDEILEMPLTLSELKPNFFGYLYKQGTTPYDGKEVHMELREANIDSELLMQYPWLYRFGVRVDENGYFEENLTPDKDYEVIGVGTEFDYYEFATPIPVTVDRDYENIITPPAHSFSGMVYDFDGNQAIYGDMNLEHPETGEWIWVRIYRDGSFGEQLKDGETYILRHINFAISETEHIGLDIRKEITIGTNTQNMVIQPNVKGIIDLGDTLGDATNEHIGMSILPVLSLEDFNNDEEKYKQYKEMQWEHEIWVNLNQEGNSVVFNTLLKEGEYIIKRIHAGGREIELNEKFTLAQTTEGNVTYTQSGQYIVTLQYAPNVNGVILENNNPVKEAWINVVMLDENWNWPMESHQWFGSNTDDNGRFTFNFDPGKYQLNQYHKPGHWEGFKWIEGSNVHIGIEFEVNDTGEVIAKDGTAISEFTIQPNIQGSIQVLNEDNTYEPLEDAWFSIHPRNEDGEPDWMKNYWGNTGAESDEFTMYLSEGKYIVTDAGSRDTWFRVNLTFDVDSLGNITNLDSTYNDNGKLIIKEALPNFRGIAYIDTEKQIPVEWGWIVVKPKDAEEHDWEKVVHIHTDKNGTFKQKIEDGQWKIVEYGYKEHRRRVNIHFEVNGNIVTSPVEGFVTADNSIAIFPQAPNFKGIIKDKEGNQVEREAWMAIKPADAKEHDWSNVIWIDNKVLEDGSWGFEARLDDGEYKVFEVSGYDLWYRTNTTFTITSSSVNAWYEIIPPIPNFTGSVYQGSTVDEEQIINRGWINIARIDSQGNQLDLQGNEIDEENDYEESKIFWHHTIGTAIENGSFALNLEEGLYKVIAVGGDGIWYNPDYEFTVENNVVDVNITQPAPNATITLTGLPQHLDSQNAWIVLSKEENDNKEYKDIKVDEKVDNDYIFVARLKDGVYNIEYIGTENGGLELENITIEVVDNAVDTTIDIGQGLNTIEGTLTINDEAVNEWTWVSIENTQSGEKKKFQTDETGNFTMLLEKDTTWKAVELGTSKGYKVLENQQQFTVLEQTITWDLNVTE